MFLLFNEICSNKEILPKYTNTHTPTPPLGQDMTQGQFFKQSLTGLNSEFPLLLDYLPHHG